MLCVEIIVVVTFYHGVGGEVALSQMAITSVAASCSSSAAVGREENEKLASIRITYVKPPRMRSQSAKRRNR